MLGLFVNCKLFDVVLKKFKMHFPAMEAREVHLSVENVFQLSRVVYGEMSFWE